jgi:hypothetical protein
LTLGDYRAGLVFQKVKEFPVSPLEEIEKIRDASISLAHRFATGPFDFGRATECLRTLPSLPAAISANSVAKNKQDLGLAERTLGVSS